MSEPRSFRLSDDANTSLEKIAKWYRTNETAALEIAIKSTERRIDTLIKVFPGDISNLLAEPELLLKEKAHEDRTVTRNAASNRKSRKRANTK